MQNFINFLDAYNLQYSFVQTNRFRKVDGSSKRLLNKIAFLAHFFIALPFHRIVMFNFSDNATVGMFPFLSRVSRLMGKKVILRKFGGSFDIFLKRVSEKKKKQVVDALKKCDLIFFETKSGIKHLNELAEGTNEKTVWFPNVREGIHIHKDSTQFNKRLAFFGHVSDEKGVGDLIKLAKILPDDYTIEIYGRIVEDKYRNFDWQAHRVKYMGEVSSQEVTKILPNLLLLLLLTSYREGYPGVIIEALSAGLPVVASNVGGIPEIVEEGVNGRLCNPGDIEAFKDAILSFTPHNYAGFCTNALESFERNFNANKVNERIYRTICSL